MIRYISKTVNGLVVKLNTNDEDFSTIESTYCDYMYWVPEDGEWTVTREDGTKETVPVTKGTLVLKLYSIDRETSREGEFVFVNNDYLKDYYERQLQYYKECKLKEKVEVNTYCDCGTCAAN